MGSHNRITEEKFKKIKKDCRTPFDDPLVSEKHKISTRTARQIRNSKNYQEYTERVFRYHGYPKGRSHSTEKKQPTPTTETVVMTTAQLWKFVLRMVLILVVAMLIILLIVKG